MAYWFKDLGNDVMTLGIPVRITTIDCPGNNSGEGNDDAI